jgi:hypothetical protein
MNTEREQGHESSNTTPTTVGFFRRFYPGNPTRAALIGTNPGNAGEKKPNYNSNYNYGSLNVQDRNAATVPAFNKSANTAPSVPLDRDWAKLSSELLIEIFSHLSKGFPNDLGRVSGVCKSWQTASRDDHLWKSLILHTIAERALSNHAEYKSAYDYDDDIISEMQNSLTPYKDYSQHQAKKAHERKRKESDRIRELSEVKWKTGFLICLVCFILPAMMILVSMLPRRDSGHDHPPIIDDLGSPAPRQ